MTEPIDTGSDPAASESDPSPSESDLVEQAAPAEPVGRYLAAQLDDDGWLTPQLTLIAGGRSNLTFVVTSQDDRRVVLRRPPLSTVLPTAHDMSREHRVMTALAGTGVPVPTTLALCTDTEVIGAPFYVMDHVEGHIVRESLPEGYASTEPERASIGNALIDVLADLHAVDPAAVGLGDYGRPTGYLSRQVRRWTSQWEATRGPDSAVDAAAAADLDGFAARLGEQQPDGAAGPIVHGDYRLDNMLLDAQQPGRIAAVLDWELSTLGDPLADLGMLYVYWRDADEGDLAAASSLLPSATALPGFPSRAQLLERYAQRTGTDLSVLPWYVAFACFKLAVILAGVAERGRTGAMIGDGFVELADRIPPLVGVGSAALTGSLPGGA